MSDNVFPHVVNLITPDTRGFVVDDESLSEYGVDKDSMVLVEPREGFSEGTLSLVKVLSTYFIGKMYKSHNGHYYRLELTNGEVIEHPKDWFEVQGTVTGFVTAI